MSQTRICGLISAFAKPNVNTMKETFREERVTYTVDVDGKLVVVENVPARVCVETGEKLFSLETAERLQQLIWGKNKPKRYVETPVYEFA